MYYPENQTVRTNHRLPNEAGMHLSSLARVVEAAILLDLANEGMGVLRSVWGTYLCVCCLSEIQ